MGEKGRRGGGGEGEKVRKEGEGRECISINKKGREANFFIELLDGGVQFLCAGIAGGLEAVEFSLLVEGLVK